MNDFRKKYEKSVDHWSWLQSLETQFFNRISHYKARCQRLCFQKGNVSNYITAYPRRAITNTWKDNI